MLGTIFEYYIVTIQVRTSVPIIEITIRASYPDLQIRAYVFFFIFGSAEGATSELRSCEL